MTASLFAAPLFLAAALAHAQGTPPVTVKDAWVRATVPAQKTTGAFMQLTSPVGTRLVEARSPVAGVTEIHEMGMVNNVMNMRAVTGVDLPAGRAMELKPGGHHIMLLELKKPVAAGESVPLTLVFQGKDGKRQSIEVKAAVRPINAPAKADEHKGHSH